MGRVSFVLCLALASGALAVSVEVTPIEKVISLIEGLKAEVETDGKAEAKTYEAFACFCRDTTGRKSGSVKRGNDMIETLSADIADKTQERNNDATELGERQQKQERLSQNLDQETVRHAAAKAEYTAEEADLSKAIQGLKDAIKAMSDSKPASFLSVRQSLSKTFEMAEVMNLLKTPKHKAVASLIQQSAAVDPNDPEFEFHSNDIIQVCQELLVDYKKSRQDLNDEWNKTDKAAKAMKVSLNQQMVANDDAMKQLTKDIARLEKETAEHRSDLVESESQMKDDELYLTDLTKQCEDRANDFDQRSAMRNDEISALAGALKVLKNKVEGRANEVNERALLQSSSIAAQASPKKAAATALRSSISFLQGASSSSEVRKQNALDVLMKEGKRLQSLTLISLVERASADPFQKVKGLIQKLIERLLTESKNEASKKGFCDTELAKARKDRDFRFTEAKDLSAELAGLEAKRDSLNEEIKQLKSDIKEETAALKMTTEDRTAEKKANMHTLKTAKEGLEAVNEALLILKSFYKQAAKASFVQASPLDEDTAGAAAGSYKGKQGASNAVFALLETIASDFDRTVRKTEEAEHEAHRDYVEYSQAAQSSIAGKTTKQELDEEDLATTLMSLKTKSDDMQTAVDLLDSALQTLEELKPTCIDTGMSYAERVAKREEEITALNNALNILAPP